LIILPMLFVAVVDNVSQFGSHTFLIVHSRLRPSMFHQLWEDECGAIDVTMYMFLITMLVIGCVVGFSAVRTNLIQEFGDLSVALEKLDHSYSYSVNGITSTYTDTPTLVENLPGDPPAGLVIVAPTADDE